jgi:hypothetical protein
LFSLLGQILWQQSTREIAAFRLRNAAFLSLAIARIRADYLSLVLMLKPTQRWPEKAGMKDEGGGMNKTDEKRGYSS